MHSQNCIDLLLTFICMAFIMNFTSGCQQEINMMRPVFPIEATAEDTPVTETPTHLSPMDKIIDSDRVFKYDELEAPLFENAASALTSEDAQAAIAHQAIWRAENCGKREQSLDSRDAILAFPHRAVREEFIQMVSDFDEVIVGTFWVEIVDDKNYFLVLVQTRLECE